MHPHAGLARRIGKLAARIAAIEQADRRRESARLVPTGWEAVDDALAGGLITSAVHEWYGVEEGTEGRRGRGTRGRDEETQREAAATRRRFGVNRQSFSLPLSILIHLAQRALAQRQSQALHVIWIGARCRPYVHALLRDGGRNRDCEQRLLARSIFIDADSVDERLWSTDLASRCPAIAAVIADGSGFDMSATRRLQLAAQMNDALVLLARPAHEFDRLSAATTRWVVSPKREEENHRVTEDTEEDEISFSEKPHLKSAAMKMRIEPRRDEGTKGLRDKGKNHRMQHLMLPNHKPLRLSPSPLRPCAPPPLLFSPRWTVQCLRCKGVQPMTREARAQLPLSFALEVDHETGNLVIPPDVADRSRPAKTSVRRSA